MKYLTLVLAVIALSGCGSNYYLKRAKINLKKAEQLGAVIAPDTVYVNRNVVIHESKVDTVFQNVVDLDTLKIETERILTKVQVNYKERKVFVESKCKSDTIIQRVPVTVTKTITSDKGIPWWMYAIIIAMGIVILFLAIRR